MSRSDDKSLLPAGLQDVLPPEAGYEAATVERLVACFARHGYERVKPPLIEFEEALLSGAGAAVAAETFRLMDPISQRMLGLRADMTVQVARIATSRLVHAPRPLRLCYAGQVLRVKGSQLRPERQFAQVGAELIGTEAEAADAEVVVLAVSALQAVGAQRLSVDLTVPPLVGDVAADLGIAADTVAALREALDRKDAAAVEELAAAHAPLFGGLLRSAGPAEPALKALRLLALPGKAAARVARLARVVELIRAALPDLTLTVDPGEHRGFEYHTGISFTLYARGVRGELGRGGRYATRNGEEAAEAATGFTLYMDTVMRALPSAPTGARLYLPHGTAYATGQELRADGWVTVAGLASEADARAEARRLGCSHVLVDGAAEALSEAGRSGEDAG